MGEHVLVRGHEGIRALEENYREGIQSLIGDIINPLTTVTLYQQLYPEPYTPITLMAGTGHYKIMTMDNEQQFHRQVAFWSLVQMPGCCGICISTNSFVSPEFRQLGLGKLLNQFRIELARMLGYGLLICTDRVSNMPQQKILKANGWSGISTFVNPRTSNIIAIHEVAL